MKQILVCLLVLGCTCMLVNAKSNEDSKEPGSKESGSKESEETEEQAPTFGSEAKVNQFPHQVFITVAGGMVCSGSLIHYQWVLTAAHCLENATSVTIRLGTIKRNKGGQIFTSSEFYIYKLYDSETGAHDIAVIKLPTKVNINPKDKSIKVIKLEQRSKSCGNGKNRKLIFSGWERFIEEEGSEILLFAQMDEITNEECFKTYGADELLPTLMCLKPKKDTSFCGADSGGALITNGDSPVQVGLAGLGDSYCSEDSVPATFIRIALYVDWLRFVTKIAL